MINEFADRPAQVAEQQALAMLEERLAPYLHVYSLGDDCACRYRSSQSL